MAKFLKENQGDLLFKVIIFALVTMIAGCAVDPGHQVQVDPIKVSKFKVGEDDFQPTTELDRATMEPVIKYGSEELFNAPAKRQYRATPGQFSLDFVNIAIEDFISVVFTEMLNKPYVLDTSIKGTVTVQTRGRVNSFQLLSIIESVLASKSAVLISRRNHYELVPIAKAKNYSFKPELYSARNIRPGYRMVVVPVNYVNPDDLKSILESVAPAAGHLKIDKERRAIVMTGSEEEISNVVDAVQIFDVSWLKSKSFALLPIENTQATIVKDEISKILTSQNKTNDVVLDTFDRFNALLVVASYKDEIDAVRNWVKILDVQVPSADTQLFVYDVQNRKASELSDILNGIFNEEAAVDISRAGFGRDIVGSEESVVLTNKQTASVKKYSSSDSSTLKFVADDTHNSIIILAKETEYKNIKAVLAELDTLPLQVSTAVSIVEVTLSDELSFGVEWFIKNDGINGGDYSSEALLDLNAGAGIGPIVPGFSYVLNGTGSLVTAVLNTLASQSKLNVISSPSLMALDNQTATIRVGDQQPVQVSSAKSTDNDVLTQSIEYKSTGVLLTVTPRVNSGGLVTMELNQEVTDVGSIDIATGQRSFLQRNINSTVAVQDGSTIVLGGLITENKVESESGIPGLYKLPLIGGLFGSTSTSMVKRELIVLITPKVIPNHQIATEITQEYANKMELLKSSLQIN